MREGMASIFSPLVELCDETRVLGTKPFMQVSPGDGDVLVEMADVGVADN